MAFRVTIGWEKTWKFMRSQPTSTFVVIAFGLTAAFVSMGLEMCGVSNFPNSWLIATLFSAAIPGALALLTRHQLREYVVVYYYCLATMVSAVLFIVGVLMQIWKFATG